MSNQSLRLRSGREVRVLTLRQEAVYSGLIEGLPTKQMNQHIIERLLTEERRPEWEPYLIVPEETPIAYSGDRPYPFGDPAALPEISCVAHLNSLDPARGGGGCSALTVVWFQDDFAFPIDKTALDRIVCLDWEKLATDYEW